MTDQAPDIIYSLDATGKPVALIERKVEMGEQAAILDRYPMLLDEAHRLELARLVNHFARGFKYEVIGDPEAFKSAYQAKLQAENKDELWKQGAPKLSDFGQPEFARIQVPAFGNGKLIFFARSVQLGVPYRVEVPITGYAVGVPSYEPVPMGPID